MKTTKPETCITCFCRRFIGLRMQQLLCRMCGCADDSRRFCLQNYPILIDMLLPPPPQQRSSTSVQTTCFVVPLFWYWGVGGGMFYAELSVIICCSEEMRRELQLSSAAIRRRRRGGRGVKERLGKHEGGAGDGGDAAEGGDNCHMQSWRG